ncbi:WavE lipopolysaccharide synthesis family protein [Bdellovibrio sp. HCB274]|uniref:WavE lipopolysaccharide synthesis family protein n=1 Tax=Bdellovibrio sp. HCB274 TaxID=3394361 RepID=UPI0039B6496F
MPKSRIFEKLIFFAIVLLKRLVGEVFLFRIVDRIGIVFNSRIQGRSYFTHHERPRLAGDVFYDEVLAIKDIGIVIQGPIDGIQEMVLETVAIYRKSVPGCKIVLSTWRNEVGKFRINFENLNVHILENDKPSISGGNNINFQIVSTINGLRKLGELGVKYAFKTRTDQRFYAPNTVPYFMILLKRYPLLKPGLQKERIIELSLNVLRYRPYSMCDMFQFGLLADLILFWNQDLDSRSFSAAQYSKEPYTLRKISEDDIAEIYIHRKFLRGIGVSSEVDYESYYTALKEHFIIVDKEMVDLVWLKYSSQEYRIAYNPIFDKDRKYARFSQKDWEILQEYGISIFQMKDEWLNIREHSNDILVI